jgi:glycosyltransferase involved in cell wall biosynthesis
VARPEVEARMVPAGDPAALAKAIQASFDEPVETAAIVARGLERAEQFSMEKLASYYLEIYEHLIRP